MGAFPGLPKVYLHNPVLAYEVGDEFMNYPLQGQGGPARSVRAGGGRIDSQREDQAGRLLGGPGDRQENRPAHPHLRLDRLAGPQGLRRRGDRHLRHLRRHPRHGRQSDRLHGPGRLPGLEMEIEGRAADHQRARLPRAARQFHGNRDAPAVSRGRAGAGAAAWTINCGPSGCSRRPCTKAATGPATTSRASSPRVRPERMPGENRLLGAGRQLQRAQTRLDRRRRRLPQRGRHLHRLHHARLPRQVHALHGRAAGRTVVVHRRRTLRQHHSHAARFHQCARPTRNPSGGIPARS